MSQETFSYLLNINRFPNFVSPWTKRNLLPSVAPEYLFELAEKYLEKYSLQWDSIEENGRYFKTFAKELKLEHSAKILGEFLVMYWFYIADITEISNQIKDTWLKWHLQQINRNHKLKKI
jgi:hypothetical protein